MTDWYCEKCPENNHKDCGEWNETNSELFKNVKQIHQNHKGWQKGKPKDKIKELESQANDAMANMLNDFSNFRKLSNEINLFEKFVHLLSKTVRNDPVLIKRILLNGLSAFTTSPTHLMIMEKTSEGKTYPALQIAHHFPKNCLIILASATPQSFKYDQGILVDENYEPIQERIDTIRKKLGSVENKEEQQSIKDQIKQILITSKILIDLRHKWIIFKEPPDSRLLEMLYSTLSGDEEFSEHKVVDKGKQNGNKTHTIVLRGTPALLICTAKNESKSERWEETFSRFDITSPEASKEKYRSGMELIANKTGLPKSLLDEFVISEEDQKTAHNIIQIFIQNILDSNSETFNPFMDKLSEIFPQEQGWRWRQFQRFNILLKLITICNFYYRPKVVINKKSVIITTIQDVKIVLDIMRESNFIAPHKLKWFQIFFKQAYEKLSEEVEGIVERVITINQIVTYQNECGGKTNTKSLHETFLNELYEFGFVDKSRDPRNKSREVYWSTNNFDSKTSLFSITSLNQVSVESCLEKYLKQRFNYFLNDKKLTHQEVTTLILSENATHDENFIPKTISKQVAISGDLTQSSLDEA